LNTLKRGVVGIQGLTNKVSIRVSIVMRSDERNVFVFL